MKLHLIAALTILSGLALISGNATLAPAQTTHYGIAGVVVLPKAPAAFDISWVDADSHRYYLGDRTNAAVDVIDTMTGELLMQIGGFTGANGVLVVPEANLLFVGDGDSTVKVIDATTYEIIATIPTGGEKRADELAYDARDHVIAVTNDAEDPPYLSFISTTSLSVVGRLDFPDATDGIEQPSWDPGTGLFYEAVPASKTNEGGEIVGIDPRTFTVTKVYPLIDCTPHGSTVGPNGQLLAGCVNPGRSIIINLADGSVAATITEVGGSDEVWYNPGDNRYYLAAGRMTSDGTTKGASRPVLGIIDAGTNTWVENVPTVTGAHSVAVDSTTNAVFLPLTNVGIGVYTAR